MELVYAFYAPEMAVPATSPTARCPPQFITQASLASSNLFMWMDTSAKAENQKRGTYWFGARVLNLLLGLVLCAGNSP